MLENQCHLNKSDAAVVVAVGVEVGAAGAIVGGKKRYYQPNQKNGVGCVVVIVIDVVVHVEAAVVVVAVVVAVSYFDLNVEKNKSKDVVGLVKVVTEIVLLVLLLLLRIICSKCKVQLMNH